MAKKDESERGGSYWVKSKNLVQVTGYIEPSLHDDLLKISEQTSVPLTKMITEALAKFRNDHEKKKAKGTAG